MKKKITGRGRDKRRRVFKKGPVQRLASWDEAWAWGYLIQIDHMSVYSDEKVIKHFNAVCPDTRAIVNRAFSLASSRKAGEFEEVAKELGVKICVLPARSPELNGMVERLNKTLRDAFYSGLRRVGFPSDQRASEGVCEVRQRGEMPYSDRFCGSHPSVGLKLWNNPALLLYDKSTFPQHSIDKITNTVFNVADMLCFLLLFFSVLSASFTESDATSLNQPKGALTHTFSDKTALLACSSQRKSPEYKEYESHKYLFSGSPFWRPRDISAEQQTLQDQRRRVNTQPRSETSIIHGIGIRLIGPEHTVDPRDESLAKQIPQDQRSGVNPQPKKIPEYCPEETNATAIERLRQPYSPEKIASRLCEEEGGAAFLRFITNPLKPGS